MKKIYILLIAIGCQLYAATAPTTGSILQEQRESQRLPQVSEKDIQKPDKEKEPVKTKESDIKVTVKEFILEGDITIFTKEYIHSLINKFIGMSLSIDELNEVLELIYNEYKINGYIVVKVFFPKQDVTDGVIRIKIIEATVDDSEDGISVNGYKLRIKKNYAIQIAKQALKPGSVINQKNLERATLILSDMPGISATSSLKKGTKKNSTKVDFELNEGRMYNTYASFDNTGGRYTGKHKAMVGVDIKDISGYGDQFSIKYTNSFGAGDLNLLSLDYSSSILYSGLRGGVKIDVLKYKLGEEFETLDLKGKSTNYSLYLSYPILRTKITNLIAKASYGILNLEDTASGTTTSKKTLNVFKATLIGNHSDKLLGGGYSYCDITYSHGTNNIKNTASYIQDQASSGAHTDGNFDKLSFGATRIQRGNDKLSLVFSASGQYAFSNLDSSEKFQLGGAYGVRAYPSGEASGDNGLKATLEGRYLLSGATVVGAVRLIGFYDYGKIQQYRDRLSIALNTSNSYSLSGAGAGISFGKQNDFDGSINVASKIGSNKGSNAVSGNDSDGTDYSGRVWFTLRKFF